MAETFAVDASPLIFLSRANHLDILRRCASKVLVPDKVVREIQQKGHNDPTARALSASTWLEIVSVTTIPSEIVAWGLGAGESSVLALAHNQSDVIAVIDDLAARRCAATLNISVRGTLGIILVAKKRGLIPSARAVMEDLIGGGLHLSKFILDEALRRVDE